MGVADALPVARNLAENAPQTALRIPAIAVLGQLGGAAELAWLKTIDLQANPRLAVPVLAAISNLTTRTL
jgi:hypothetical protein